MTTHQRGELRLAIQFALTVETTARRHAREGAAIEISGRSSDSNVLTTAVVRRVGESVVGTGRRQYARSVR